MCIIIGLIANGITEKLALIIDLKTENNHDNDNKIFIHYHQYKDMIIQVIIILFLN